MPQVGKLQGFKKLVHEAASMTVFLFAMDRC